MSEGKKVAWALVGLLALASACRAGPPVDPHKALADNLRTFLLGALPDPLFEDLGHWGKQKRFGSKEKNHGRWYKVKLQAINPKETLALDLRDFRKAGADATTFTLHLALDARVTLDRQTWRRGVRLYSGSTRARLRVKMTLRCEVTSRVEKSAGLLPEVVFRLRVLGSDLRYDNLVVEHTAGVGGDMAQVLGEILIGGVKTFRPSLERKLLDKANAAIVKAGDTKEVRVSLLQLLGKK
jgi:hypothetical protein